MTGADTKVAMIEAAERIIAERGVGNFSLREVYRAAGQRNKSAATYHFGTKEGLLLAILDYRMGPINELRAQRLDSLSAALTGEQGIRLVDLVKVLIDPLAAHTVATPESGYARFLARAEADPVFLPIARAATQSTSYRKWRNLTAEQLTHLPKPIRYIRIDRVVAMVIQTLALWEDGRGKRGQRLETLIDDLAETCEAVLAAPDPSARPSSGVVPKRILSDRLIERDLALPQSAGETSA